MRLFPVFIDARPVYLAGAPGMSLLQMSTGPSSILERLRVDVGQHVAGDLLVVTDFEPDPSYVAALRRQSDWIEDVLSPAAFARRLHTWEPSDFLLFRDCRTATAQPLDVSIILADVQDGPCTVRHLLVPAGTSGGTTDRLVLDGEGRVVRIQRYYERVTWTFAAGVACSLVPVASLQGLSDPHVASLSELRSWLASSGVPGHDFFTQAEAFDLRREAGLLSLIERVLQPSPGQGCRPWVAPSASVHPRARLRGAVVVAEEAVIEEGALVIGPSVIGRGSRVACGALVAQSVIVAQTDVPANAVARQRVVTEAVAAAGALADDLVPREDSGAPRRALAFVDQQNVQSVVPLKAPVESVGALVTLVLLSPLFALVAAAVKLTSRGPVFYGDIREGRGGRDFRCWKFRTMYADAAAHQRELAGVNEVDGPQFKMVNDPRVTPLGRWLRRLNLDELPQVFNVLRAEMSFVGPRPSPFRENQICIPWRDARLSVTPGITGLWQVCRDRSVNADFQQWIYYDLLYVNHASAWLDFKILAATALTLGGHWPIPLRWLIRKLALQPEDAPVPDYLPPRDRPRLGHLPVDGVTRGEALDCIAALVREGHGGTVFTPNVDHVLLAEDDSRFRAAYAATSLCLVDGMPVLWAMRLAGQSIPEKISGSDLVRPLAARAVKEGWRIFLVGGAPGVGERVAQLLRAEQPLLTVAGVESPIVDMDGPPDARRAMHSRIREARPHLVLVALGSPKGELWAEEARDELRPAVVVAVGAALDFLAGRARRAPAWMSNSGLEWLYRLAHEPRRLARRYLVRGPRFLRHLVRARLDRRRTPREGTLS